MPTKTNQVKEIRQLLSAAAKESWQDLRAERRFAFFRPVSIQINGEPYSAFSRDISPSSIGLAHCMELPLGEVEIAVPTESDRTVKLWARLEQCIYCGQGWYISGGKFVESE